MIETIQKNRDNHRVFSTLMADLSKAFDCISQKLNVLSFDETSLKVIISCLKNRTQTDKVSSSFSALLNI